MLKDKFVMGCWMDWSDKIHNTCFLGGEDIGFARPLAGHSVGSLASAP